MALHRLLGITRAVIVQASCHGADNSATLDAIAASGGRYKGIAIVDESADDKEFRKLDAGGIKGVRFNFVQHLGGRPDMKFFQRTVARIKELGWHLVLHLDAKDIAELSPMIKALPLPFIIDHMGRVKAGDGLGTAALQGAAGIAEARNLLDQGVRLGARFDCGPAFHRRHSLRPGHRQGRARPRAVGHRLAPSEYRQAHAE